MSPLSMAGLVPAGMLIGCLPVAYDGGSAEVVDDSSTWLSDAPEGALVAGDLWCDPPSEDEVLAISPDALPQGDSPCRTAELVRVDYVTDGDTVHVERLSDGGTESVRVIGVDTPEVWGTEECYGPEASAFAKSVLNDRLIWLSFDGDCLDDYDRTLAYVHLSTAAGCFFERLLMRGGYADTMTFSATSTYAATFEADGAWASEHSTGMWAACR